MLELISEVQLPLGGILIFCISLIPVWDQKRSGERQLDPSLLGPTGWWDVIWVRERVDGSIMSVLRSVWVGVQVGGRLILLICDSCQRPLEEASVRGRVTYSYTAHTREGRIQVQGCVAEGGCWGVLQGAFVSWDLVWTGKLMKVDTRSS